MRVLLVEDDHMIGELVAQALKEAAYAVDWVRDGDTALNSLDCITYDVLLLDLGLPKKNGMEILTTLREKKFALPILIITARDALDSRLQGLDKGADDYIVKPFEMAELLARIRAVLRRKDGNSSPLLSNGVVNLNPATHVAEIGNLSVRLSNREFCLLQSLLIRPGAILSRDELENRIYAWGEEVESNAIEFLIHSLRKKLGTTVIKNVRGVGWMVSKEL